MSWLKYYRLLPLKNHMPPVEPEGQMGLCLPHGPGSFHLSPEDPLQCPAEFSQRPPLSYSTANSLFLWCSRTGTVSDSLRAVTLPQATFLRGL